MSQQRWHYYRGCAGAVFEAELTAAVDCDLPGAVAEFPAAGVLRCGGVGGFRPAVLEPRPSFCRLLASSLPLGLRLFSDWNFSRAETVVLSHLPLASPW